MFFVSAKYEEAGMALGFVWKIILRRCLYKKAVPFLFSGKGVQAIHTNSGHIPNNMTLT